MTEQMTPDQKNQVLFLNLIMSFQAAALQQMGKMKNPITDKLERDLQQAQLTIDMIDMLKTKTTGNLNNEETELLDRMLRELKMNYVDELDKSKKEAAEQPTETEEKKKEEVKSEEKSSE
jgi:hypothetical protein